MVAGLLLLGAALGVGATAAGPRAFVAISCTLRGGSVVMHPGLEALRCPGTRVVRVPWGGERLSLQVLSEGRASVLVDVPVAPTSETGVDVVPGAGLSPVVTWRAPVPRADDTLRPDELDWEERVRDAVDNPGQATVDTAPTVRAPPGRGPSAAEVGTWAGLGLAVVGASALAAGVTTILAGSEARAPGPRLGVPGFSVSALALTAPAMLVVGVLLVGAGAAVFLAAWLWERRGA